MTDHLLQPTEIPLIITSTNSSPDASRNVADRRRKSVDVRKQSTHGEGKTLQPGGSFKYEIGRNRSVSNLISLPAKWSSVRIKGTGFNESRKSIVKIEACNGLPMGKNMEYQNLLSPTQNQVKKNIGNVSGRDRWEGCSQEGWWFCYGPWYLLK
jgi:hypothetical protein